MYTFKKEERLCNKSLIDELFHSGSSFLCYPYKASWRYVTEPQKAAAQVLFSVSKKRYRNAVDRNAVKRRMREVYRLNKQQLLYDYLQADSRQIILSVGYIGKAIESYDLMEKKMIKLLAQLNNELTK